MLEGIDGKEGCGGFQISCQNNNLKSVYADYIYRICYKNAKKANPVEWICPY
jgi:hypothetical protein